MTKDGCGGAGGAGGAQVVVDFEDAAAEGGRAAVGGRVLGGGRSAVLLRYGGAIEQGVGGPREIAGNEGFAHLAALLG